MKLKTAAVFSALLLFGLAGDSVLAASNPPASATVLSCSARTSVDHKLVSHGQVSVSPNGDLISLGTLQDFQRVSLDQDTDIRIATEPSENEGTDLILALPGVSIDEDAATCTLNFYKGYDLLKNASGDAPAFKVVSAKATSAAKNLFAIDLGLEEQRAGSRVLKSTRIEISKSTDGSSYQLKY